MASWTVATTSDILEQLQLGALQSAGKLEKKKKLKMKIAPTWDFLTQSPTEVFRLLTASFEREPRLAAEERAISAQRKILDPLQLTQPPTTDVSLRRLPQDPPAETRVYKFSCSSKTDLLLTTDKPK